MRKLTIKGLCMAMIAGLIVMTGVGASQTAALASQIASQGAVQDLRGLNPQQPGMSPQGSSTQQGNTARPVANGQIGTVLLYCNSIDYVTLRESASINSNALATIKSREAVQYLGISGDFYYVLYNGKYGYALQAYLSLDPAAPLNAEDVTAPVTAPVQTDSETLYCRASDYATLRQSAATTSAALARIGSREKVQYISTVGAFYKVKYKGMTGYVLKDYFSADPNAPLNYSESGTVISTETTQLYCRASIAATLRETASRAARELATVPSRASVEYISSSGDFYYVTYQGQKGYVLKEFFSTDPQAELNYGNGNASSTTMVPGTTVLYCRASDYATLRAKASRDSQALAIISSRASVIYQGTVGEFYAVRYQNQDGYVLKNYFSTDINAELNYGLN